MKIVSIFLLMFVAAARVTQAQDQRQVWLLTHVQDSIAARQYESTLRGELSKYGFEVRGDNPNFQVDQPTISAGYLEEIGPAIVLVMLDPMIESRDVAAAILTTPNSFPDFESFRMSQQGLLGDTARSEVAQPGTFVLRLWTHSWGFSERYVTVSMVGETESLVANTEREYWPSYWEENQSASNTGVSPGSAFIPSNLWAETTIPAYDSQRPGDTVLMSNVFRPPLGLPPTAATVVSRTWWRGLNALDQHNILMALEVAEIAASSIVQSEILSFQISYKDLNLLATYPQTFDDRSPAAVAEEAAAFRAGVSISEIQEIKSTLGILSNNSDPDDSDKATNAEASSNEPQERAFFVTNRRFDPDVEPFSFRFANTEDAADTITCGELEQAGKDDIGEVALPPSLKAGSEILRNSDCVDIVSRAASEVGEKVTLFIHGYSNTFDDAVRTGLALVRDAHYGGVTVIWSWASGGGLEDYLYDTDGVQIAEPIFTEYVNNLAQRPEVTQIDFIAHSMGSRLATKLLRDNWIERPSAVVLAAADVSRGMLKQAARMATQAHITVIATDGDLALRASTARHQRSRAGLAQPMFLFDGVDTIDVSAFDDYFSFNHRHAFEKREVLDDLSQLFSGTWSASERGLDVMGQTSPIPYYVIH